MSTAVLSRNSAAVTRTVRRSFTADKVLRATAGFWFAVILAGQFAFAFTIASFYALTAMRGNVGAWNKNLQHGYVAGDNLGNTALIGHILFATIISIAGALQLIPRIRSRFPAFHRWNGRTYLLAAFTQGITGLYLITAPSRGIPGGLTARIAISLSAVLMMLFSVLALRYAMARDFKTHRRWALRLFLVASGSWFFRIGFFLTVAVFGPIGFDPTTFSGPLITFWSFGEYLLPLAVLELYLRTQERPGAVRRMAMAGVLFVLTLVMAAGILVVAAGSWTPQVKAAFDSRKSIAETLSATIATNGIDQAVRQYHALKAAARGTYNFDEDELNALGYQLIRANKLKEAIRIFQLNVEAYPQSSNVYDSLGEGYMDDGDKALAIANYQKSLQLNPKNHNAVQMIRKMKAS